MKIALIDPSLFTWPYDVHLVRGLSSLGHVVTVYGRKSEGEVPESELHLLRPHFYPGLERPRGAKDSRLFMLRKGVSHALSMARLLVLLRRERPDAIHFQWTPLAIVDRWFIGHFRRIAPTVLTVHDSAPFNNNPRSWLQRVGATSIFRKFDRLIVHTEAAKSRLVAAGIDLARIKVIAHGLFDPLDTTVTPAPSPDDRVSLLLFGQIKPYKGLETLIKAVALLPATVRAKIRVKVVGRPQMPMEPVFDLVKALGVEDAFDFDLRFVPDEEIAPLLAAADIEVFPYLEIDASGVLMLALQAGRPIVASQVGLFAELLDPSHGGLVPPGDAQALASVLQPLITDKAKREKAAAAVVSLKDSIPSWASIGQQTTDLYRDVRA